nr:MAG TPA: hypothetical protein [Caudoviricetes sp.]
MLAYYYGFISSTSAKVINNFGISKLGNESSLTML